MIIFSYERLVNRFLLRKPLFESGLIFLPYTSLILNLYLAINVLPMLMKNSLSMRNIGALILILASLACLYPGLMFAMLTIKVGTVLPLIGQVELYEATQSILQTIKSLFADQNYLVAWLILIFSVVVPVLKVTLLLVVLIMKQFAGREKVFKFVSVIGKWSMADVFVVSIFMAYLATKSNEAVSATLHSGFYYFTAYCVLSILGTQLIELEQSD